MADAYHAKNPNVTIKITPLENEAFKARLTTVAQAGTPPDLFHTWGGGVLKQQTEAGLTKDLTDDLADIADSFTPTALLPYQIDERTYGVPFDVGMVGFWYNKKLFTQAGITQPPATWTELLDAVRKLKAANITPIALGGKEKWPGHFYWAYLAMRVAGVDALKQAESDGKFDAPEFTQAGERLKELVDLQPFQKGFLGAPYGSPDGQSAVVGNGRAAMELMGQWAPNEQRTSSANKKGLGDDLGFFPFPAVDGGKGAVTDAFGGGGGFAVGRDAPPEAVDFLKFISSPENQRKAAAVGGLLPVVEGAEDAVKEPSQKLVVDQLAKATKFQLYLDQAYAPAVGQTVNDAVQQLFAGKATPEEVSSQIADAAKAG
jgi:raffinose/stachyose/melibiose transport system substrate-binding protein